MPQRPPSEYPPVQARRARKRRPPKSLKLEVRLAIAAVVLLLGIGLLFMTIRGIQGLFRSPVPTVASSAIATAISQSGEERIAQLETILKSSEEIDHRRARYLLAVAYLEEGQGEQAIAQLKNLESDYDVLAPHILVKRAQAYEKIGDRDKAQQVWQQLLKTHKDDPTVAEALYQLGRPLSTSTNDQAKKQSQNYWDEAIARFPAHPRTVAIAQERLGQIPDDKPLQLLVAQYGLYLPDITQTLDHLLLAHSADLTPEEWETVAFAYWEKQEYLKGGQAYSKAPKTAQNRYRAARGLQLGEQNDKARDRYQTLIKDFPKEPEAARALFQLAAMASSDTAALPFLDNIIENYPDRAGEALLEKAHRFEGMKQPQAVAAVGETLLKKFGKTEAAADWRWELAEKAASKGNWKEAVKWGQQLVEQNPTADRAPQALFWLGKWATRLNQTDWAQKAFRSVLADHPQSYYGWRAAHALGLTDVGDFTTVRSATPTIRRPIARTPLPVGSPALQELYQLGQDREAWELWQVEFQNRRTPSVNEQFTDGLLRLGIGENLDGIFMLGSLAWRDTPEDQAQFKALHEQRTYWQSLYPFPFAETIAEFATQQQLNPLLVTALIRQESRFDPKIQSVVGATGLMQLMPDTAAWVASNLSLKTYTLQNPIDNVRLGTWYFDHTHDIYRDNSMLAIASYNAGPGNVDDWVKRFGLTDPDWFVEQVPFPETEGYIKSVFENYWNYLRLYNPEISQLLAGRSPIHARLNK